MKSELLVLPVDKMRQVMIDFAKRWLAHDGFWFLAAEERLGMEAAIELDAKAWQGFAASEARRILRLLDEEKGGGLELLARALSWRMYALINPYDMEWDGDNKLKFYMRQCRVQDARVAKQLPPFPCKSVGETEYREFSRAIDPRIKVCCLGCPPDDDYSTDQFMCGWEFTIDQDVV